MPRRKPTLLEYALLGIAHNQARTGYAIRKVFETTPMAHYSSSPGAIYPALHRLSERGLLSSRVGDAETLRPKRVFRITAEGVEELRAWVSQAVTRDDVVWRIRELMLRFSFMGSLVPDEVTRGFLEQLAAEVDGYRRSLEQHRSGMPAAGPPHGRLAVDAGVANLRALSQWAREAMQEFPAPEPSRERR